MQRRIRGLASLMVVSGAVFSAGVARAGDYDVFAEKIRKDPSGLAAVGIAGLLYALVVMWALEALAYCEVARLTWRRAGLTSLAANLGGLVIVPVLACELWAAGLGAGSPADPVVFWLLPGVLALWAQLAVTYLMNRGHEGQGRLLGVAAIAGLMSAPVAWAAMFALIEWRAAFPPS